MTQHVSVHLKLAALAVAVCCSAQTWSAHAGPAEAKGWEQFAKLSHREQDLFAIRSTSRRFPSQPPRFSWRIGMATSKCMRTKAGVENFGNTLKRCLKRAGSVHAKKQRQQKFQTTVVAITRPTIQYRPSRAKYPRKRAGLAQAARPVQNGNMWSTNLRKNAFGQGN